ILGCRVEMSLLRRVVAALRRSPCRPPQSLGSITHNRRVAGGPVLLRPRPEAGRGQPRHGRVGHEPRNIPGKVSEATAGQVRPRSAKNGRKTKRKSHLVSGGFPADPERDDISGAEGGTRTRTPLRADDFESSMSTNSITSAC